MIKTCALAALTAGALAVSAPAATAQPYGAPTGQLSGSCRNVQTLQTGYVSAECRDDQGRYLWSTIYAPQCRSELTNRNGALSCLGAQATVGSYVDQGQSQQTSPVGALLGALAGAFLGGGQQTPYTPGARYPVWGESGYGDPRSDPRFGAEGWGYGAAGQWVPIARRQPWLERRIVAGERQGRLTRAEAASLRQELTTLDRLEARYGRDGLSNAERADLDRRFDALSARIRIDSQDGQDNQAGWENINQRQARLDARIDAGIRDRSLTSVEAARLRSEFQAIARLESTYRQGGLSDSERADLDRRFDALSARIGDDRQDAWEDINRRQARLDARIDAGIRDRSLSSTEASRLRAEFQAIARLEATYRQNGLSDSERADLDRRFDALSARIGDQRQDSENSWENINQRQARLDARIDAGIRDRSLSSTEASRLRAEFQAIARLESTYRQGGLSDSERADLDRRFDALSARIGDDRQDAWEDINQRQARLDARIDAGVRDRSLSSAEAARLRSEFQAIARLEATYRRDGLSDSERADLDRRFDALSARIGDERQDAWEDINQRQARLDARIDAGIRDRSLTSVEAARLRSEFQAIARLESTYRQNGLSDSERADLDRRFDALSARIGDDRTW